MKPTTQPDSGMSTAMKFLATVQEKPRKYYAIKNGKIIGEHMLKPSQLKQFGISMGCTFMRATAGTAAKLKGKDSE